MSHNETGFSGRVGEPAQTLRLESWFVEGDDASVSDKRLIDLEGVFADEKAFGLLDPSQIVYTVRAYMPVAAGTPGGLFLGSTTIASGKVGGEYFMTRGHVHEKAEKAEYYWGIEGKGALILMDSIRNTWAEKVFPGSLHYIAGNIAHRLVNTGSVPLIAGACWHSDAGHNYEMINKYGFSARLLEVRGVPTLVESRG